MSEAAIPQIVWLHGPRAVGKSTIGYSLFTRLNRTVAKSAYLDLSQLAFCHPAPATDPHHHTLKADTLAACWRTFQTAGAHHLVLTGTLTSAHDLDPYRKALTDSAITLIHLDATPDVLTARFTLRTQGGGPAIPGDALRSLPAQAVPAAITTALHEAQSIRAAAIEGPTFDTSKLSVQEAADQLFAMMAGH